MGFLPGSHSEPRQRSATIYKDKNGVFSSQNVTRLVIVACIITLLIGIFNLASSPSDNANASRTSTAKVLNTTPDSSEPLHDKDSVENSSDLLPFCRFSQPQFNGTSSFSCVNENTTVQFELIHDEQQIESQIENYGLIQDDQVPTHYIRSGMSNGSNRLMAINTNTGTLLNIESDKPIDELILYWTFLNR